ncbi:MULTISPECIES: hypothetical protein [Nostoc]|uniref:Uncharacterized protein n=1 Tax=Nostoc paludosum FACHB-159 TaxID=2692908 RepID=A0ABR8KGP6_9NOSO|nr:MULTISPECIES: hypothetical protein [Nostoc]MBD2681496.1 hypothetical protein [Nostoc sp. FACHB-857]MBD2737956.1 hypothetical protein [Nostoc paludosum FACHB-159]
MTQKSRSELQGLFKTGTKPSQQDFADFIESTLNIKDDGIEKPSGADTPLKITAQGTDEKLMDFYAGETKTWSFNQKSGDKQGLNISNSGGSRLFIANSNGNVGLSIDQPTAKLHIQQTANEDALRIDDELNDTTAFLINKDGNVGIGTITPGAKLEINGNLKLQQGIAVNKISNDVTLAGNSDLTIPTEKAIKTYADTKALLAGSANQDFQTKNLTVNSNLKLQQGVTVNKISNDVTLAGNSDLTIPTEKAIKTYADTKALLAGSATQDFQTNNLTVNSNLKLQQGVTVNKISNDGTLAGNSDLAIPTEKAIKTYADTKALLAGSATQDFQTKNLTVSGSLTVTNSLSLAGSTGSMVNIDLSGHVQLKEYSTQNLAFFQARDDSSNRDIGLRIRTQKKGDSKPAIVDAITISPDGNIGIGTTTTGAKLEVNGSLKATSLQLTTKLISVKKYSNIGDNTNFKTDYSTSRWICSIAGFNSGSGDINEGGVGEIIKVYTYPNSDGWWYIRGDFYSHNKDENWTVWLMAISVDIAEAANSL